MKFLNYCRNVTEIPINQIYTVLPQMFKMELCM